MLLTELLPHPSKHPPVPIAATSSPFLPQLLLLLLLLSSFSAKTSSSSQQEEEKLTILSIKSQWGNTPIPRLVDLLLLLLLLQPLQLDRHSLLRGSVTGLALPNTGLDHPIPTAICSLTNLSVLEVDNNNLPRPFPTALYSCPSLTYLDLSHYLFVGALPPDIHLLSPRTLTYLSLAANNFTRDIPASISCLSSLNTLLLNDNLFNGTFPSSLGRLTSLRNLTLAYNPFTPSSIPPELEGLTNLTYLFMAKMNLMGKIPDSFANLIHLQHLDLHDSRLSGVII